MTKISFILMNHLLIGGDYNSGYMRGALLTRLEGQKHIKVCLQENSGQLELEISDQGVGFDVGDKRNSGGLGLVSMAERISQVNGTFSIDSQLNMGTRIRARVPLAAEAKAMTNASI